MLKRMDIQLNEPTNQNSIKFSKVVDTTNKALETSLINSPMSPSSLNWDTADVSVN